MEDYKQLIEINITKEEASEKYPINGGGFCTGLAKAIAEAEYEFNFNYVYEIGNEFSKKYKNVYDIKINHI